jgi:hypothetical protein
MEFCNAQDGQKSRPAVENMRGMWKAVCVAQKMGERLGKCTLLLGSL